MMSLQIEGVSRKFHTRYKVTSALEQVNLQVKPGEFVCIVGPSGCGKTTLLNIVAGLEKASEGRVLLNGREVKEAGPDRAVMFQESALFPWLKVIDNVEFGMKMVGIPKEERHKKALQYLQMVNLVDYQNSFIHELSGGMKQRVALARALTLDSQVLLMDEPFAALDSQTKSMLQAELVNIWKETKKTILFITHSIEEAVLLGDRVITMSSNPGKISKEFQIHLDRPRDPLNHAFAVMVADVTRNIREEVEKVGQIAKMESKAVECHKKSFILRHAHTRVGTGL